MNNYQEHYARMERELSGLLSRNQRLLENSELEDAEEFIEAREYGILHEVIATAFSRHPSLVSREDASLMHTLATQMHLEAFE